MPSVRAGAELRKARPPSPAKAGARLNGQCHEPGAGAQPSCPTGRYGLRETAANGGGPRVTVIPNMFDLGPVPLGPAATALLYDVRTHAGNTLPCMALDGGRSATDTDVHGIINAGARYSMSWTHIALIAGTAMAHGDPSPQLTAVRNMLANLPPPSGTSCVGSV